MSPLAATPLCASFPPRGSHPEGSRAGREGPSAQRQLDDRVSAWEADDRVAVAESDAAGPEEAAGRREDRLGNAVVRVAGNRPRLGVGGVEGAIGPNGELRAVDRGAAVDQPLGFHAAGWGEM